MKSTDSKPPAPAGKKGRRRPRPVTLLVTSGLVAGADVHYMVLSGPSDEAIDVARGVSGVCRYPRHLMFGPAGPALATLRACRGHQFVRTFGNCYGE